MGHITFVHGIGNKPAPEHLLRQWRGALQDDGGLDLDALGVSAAMVYWADLLHGTPASVRAGHESDELELAAGVPAEDVDFTWLADLPADERGFVERLAREVGVAAVEPTPTEEPDRIDPASALEAIPLPDRLKKRLMRALLREVHHYLWDAEFTPRPGETYRIRRDVRARTLDALREGATAPGPHVVLGHSLGSVIAYDVLTGLDAAPEVDALITVGSPLGISEVQERLAPPWTRADGWPSARLADGPWSNVYDGFDPVCGGFDRRIAGDYRRRGTQRITDVAVTNTGSWRHSIGKYLGQDALRRCLRDILG